MPTSSGVGAVSYKAAITEPFTIPSTGAVTTDSSGNIYMAPSTVDTVQQIIKVLAGTTDTVVINEGSTFQHMQGIAIDATGNFYVTCISSGSRTVSEVLKLPAGGGAPIRIGAGYSFDVASRIALDALGNVYVTDFGKGTLVKIPADGTAPVVLVSGVTQITGVTVDIEGNVYYSQFNNANIMKLPAGGGSPIVAFSGSYTSPGGLAIDASGNIFASYPREGGVTEFPSGGGSPINLTVYNTPLGIAADRNGNVFVVDGLGESNTVVLKEATPNGGYFINSPLPVGLIFNNTTGIISGTPIVATPATNYTITAYNISGSASANLNISVLLNNDHLANLKVDSGKLSPAFSSSITSYTDSVSSDSLRITPVLIDTLGTVTVGGTIVKSGMALRVPLIVGSNIIPIKVTASDGITSQTYTLTVKRSPPSSNAGLSNIVLNNGTLSPGFSTSVTSYTAITTYGNITVTPTALNQYATIAVNGQAVNSRSTSGPIPLRFGVNTLTTKVTAQDGTVQNYTITLTRLHASSIHTLAGLFVNEGTLTPAFNADSFHYADRVTDTTAFITVRPKPADATETIMVNDTVLASGNPSGTVSPQIPLVAGYNVIRILVTSQNGLQRYYVINVIKPRSPDANLDSLVISKGTLSPSFNADTTTYTDSVSNSTIGVAIKAYPENPYTTLRINGIKTAPGVESANIPLKVGNTILQVAVRAQDGEIKNYTINLNRAASSNADLDTIVLGPRTPYSPVFNPDSIYYTAYVANKVTQLAIRAQTSVTTSTLKMNQIIVYNNQISPVPLMVGSNPVIYQVTAQDGITTKTYNFNIIRASADTGTTDLVNRPSLDDGLIVHQAITPNGDGINDVLTIDKIAAFPNNKLMIISNSGALVNEASRYDNKLKAFDGHSSINGKLLPAGTYFYSLQYTINGKSKTKTGYVVLKY